MEEDQEKKKRGGRYCVATSRPNDQSCFNTRYIEGMLGISMHIFLTNPKQRKSWVRFVQRHRLSALCFIHFEPKSRVTVP